MAPGLLPDSYMRPRTEQRGFTLIELLVVVAILGVLLAIAIPQFVGRQGAAYNARIMGDARNAATAEEAYFDDHGAYYAGTCDGLPSLELSPGVSCTAELSGGGFMVTASHPQATKSCVWSTDSMPPLNCASL